MWTILEYNTEFVEKKLFCILKHILEIREYLAYFSYFRAGIGNLFGYTGHILLSAIH